MVFALQDVMKKYILLISLVFLFTGCFNKHGISLKYYSDCEEYYDVQGYYHKECGKDDVVTYEELDQKRKEAADYILGKEEEKPKGNVW